MEFAAGSVASTSASPPGASAGDPPTKRKPAPTGIRSACDACRERRIRCVFDEPVKELAGRPELYEKDQTKRCHECSRYPGKLCTYTKKQRKKRECKPKPAPAPTAPITTTNSPLGNPQPPDAYVSWVSTSLAVLPVADAASRLYASALSAELFQSLFAHFKDVFRAAPFMMPVEELHGLCEANSFRVDLLPPCQRAMATTLMAHAAVTSGHPGIINLTSHSSDALVHKDDLRAIGRSREPQVQALWKRALQEARNVDAATVSNKWNLATAQMLDYLHVKLEPEAPGKAWGGCWIQHIRATEPPRLGFYDGVIWLYAVMSDVLGSLILGCPSTFSERDELDLLGYKLADKREPPLEANFRSCLLYMNYVGSRGISLARQIQDTFLCRHARSSPFDHGALFETLAELDRYQAMVTAYAAFLVGVKSSRDIEQLSIDLFPVSLMTAYGVLCNSLFKELDRRASTFNPLAESAPADTREHERVLLSLLHVKRHLRQAVRGISNVVHVASVSIVHVIQLHQAHCKLDQWAELALSLADVGSSTVHLAMDGQQADEELQSVTLGRLIEGLKRYGWAWNDRTDLVGRLERARTEELAKEVAISYSAVYDFGAGMSLDLGGGVVGTLDPAWMATIGASTWGYQQ